MKQGALIVSLVVCFILLFPLFADGAFAGIKVLGGLTHENTVSPGERYDGSIRLMNPGAGVAHVKIFQSDYRFLADGTNEYGDPGSTARSNARWIEMSPARLAIPSGKTVDFYYEVEVPREEGLKGTYWSVIMVEPVADAPRVMEAEMAEQMGMGVRTVVRYAVQIITNIGESGESTIRLFGQEIVKSNGNTWFQIDLENTGDCWLRPSVWMELYDASGASVGRFESGARRVFPECSVRHQMDVSSVSPGAYTALVIVDNGDDRVFGANYSLTIDQ